MFFYNLASPCVRFILHRLSILVVPPSILRARGRCILLCTTTPPPSLGSFIRTADQKFAHFFRITKTVLAHFVSSRCWRFLCTHMSYEVLLAATLSSTIILLIIRFLIIQCETSGKGERWFPPSKLPR